MFRDVFFNKKAYFFFTSLFIIFLYNLIFLPYLSTGYFHYDFQSFLTRFIFGKIWFLKNGLSIPWFGPHICCGIPFYGDPESQYYSINQILFLFLNPLSAIKVIFVLYSIIAFYGTYLLLRKTFLFSYNSSLLGSTLFLFNNYVSFHYLSGHMSWGVFSAIPFYFYLSSIPFNINNDDKFRSIFYLLISGLFFALMIHSGGTRMIVEIMLSLYFITLFHVYKFKNFKIIIFVTISTILGLLISSSKIYAAWSFVSGISRDISPLYFNSYLDFASVFFQFFFLVPSAEILAKVQNLSASLTMEELSFNISIVPLVLVFFYIRTFPSIAKNNIQKLSLLGILFGALIIILLNFSNTYLGQFVQKIPIITTDWLTFRLLAPLIFFFVIFSSFVIEKLRFKKENLIITFLISIIILQNIIFDRNKLLSQFNFALKPLFNHQVSAKTVNDFKIENIISIMGERGEFTGPKQHFHFLENESMQFCYFSNFGYELEYLAPIVKDINFHTIINLKPRKDVDMYENPSLSIFPEKNLEGARLYRGNPLNERNGKLNFINPACYLYPNENNCKDDFQFKNYEKDELIKFLNYKPYNFNMSQFQILLNYLSIILFLGSVLYILFWMFYFKNKKNPSKIKS